MAPFGENGPQFITTSGHTATGLGGLGNFEVERSENRTDGGKLVSSVLLLFWDCPLLSLTCDELDSSAAPKFAHVRKILHEEGVPRHGGGGDVEGGLVDA